jgi:hypothetical protein
MAGPPVVCVYTCCDTCWRDPQQAARIEDQYHRDLWQLHWHHDLGEDNADLRAIPEVGPAGAWQMMLYYWELVPQEDRLLLLKEAFRQYTPAMREAVRELLDELDEDDAPWADHR